MLYVSTCVLLFNAMVPLMFWSRNIGQIQYSSSWYVVDAKFRSKQINMGWLGLWMEMFTQNEIWWLIMCYIIINNIELRRFCWHLTRNCNVIHFWVNILTTNAIEFPWDIFIKLSYTFMKIHGTSWITKYPENDILPKYRISCGFHYPCQRK